MHVIIVITSLHDSQSCELSCVRQQINTSQIPQKHQCLVIKKHSHSETNNEDAHKCERASLTGDKLSLSGIFWLAFNALIILKHVVQADFLVTPFDHVFTTAPSLRVVTLKACDLRLFDFKFDAYFTA